MSIKSQISLTLLVLATALTAANAHDQGKPDLCDKVQHKDLCKSIVKGSKDYLEALEAAIKKTIEATKNTRGSLAALDQSQKDPKSGIEKCEKAYEAAQFELEQAQEILTSKNYRGFKSYVSAAIVHYSSCQNLITNLHETGPLASETAELMKEISIVSDLYAQIREV